MSRKENKTLIIRAELMDFSPTVWRDLEVPAEATLHQLHLILQVAMGWEQLHEYAFSVGEHAYLSPESAEIQSDRSALSISLNDLSTETDASFSYTYYSTDCWQLHLQITGARKTECTTHPVCADGSGACPADDGEETGYRNPAQTLGDLHDFDRDDINFRLEWYWEFRDPQPSDWSISSLCSSFLQQMRPQETDAACREHRRNLSTLTDFLDDRASTVFPLDSYLMKEKDLKFTEVANLGPLFMLLDIYFVYYLLWQEVCTASALESHRDTVCRFASWLVQKRMLDEESLRVCRKEVQLYIDQAKELLSAWWVEFEHPQADFTHACTIRRPLRVLAKGRDNADLLDPDDQTELRGVICSSKALQRLDSGMMLPAEITAAGDELYLTGALLTPY